MKICIDAGHGGRDSGAIGVNGRKEKDDNLRFANTLAERLRAIGMVVVQTRIGDTYPGLLERVNMANDAKADYFISIHRNAYKDPSANGIECLVSPKASAMSGKIAQAIRAHLVAVGGRDRGVKLQNATVLDKTKMPAVTLEIGFVTNVGDNALFDSRFDRYVSAVVEGLCEAAGYAKPVNPYIYTAKGDTPLLAVIRTVKAGEKVELESYFEGDALARIKGGNRVIFKDFGK